MTDADMERSEPEPRLMVVTHREPFRVVERDGEKRIERTTGGLVTALEPAMRAKRGVWVSAPGGAAGSSAVTSPEKGAFDAFPYEWVPAAYDAALYEGFYEGISNQALWPLYHSMLGRAVYDRNHWPAYERVNRVFADAAVRHAEAGDFIWVHDYQLALVPRMLREGQLPGDARIGYFLHIPFPPYDLFRTLPWSRQILAGMLGASLVGFHVAEYCHNFFDSVEQILGARCDRLRGRVLWEDRWVNVRAVPIGIDTEAFQRICASEPVRTRAEQIREEVGCEHLIVGVDRLDYTKGIVERLRALEAFFADHPHRLGQVSMMQLAVPSRAGISEYQQLREQIEQTVGHINGLYARPGWTPITYMARSLPFEELVALYLASDVAMVTPLRDGMNLVAKEFCAAHTERDGILILSELAGAASQLTEALLVNPYDIDGMSAALETALTMRASEVRRRMGRMNAKIDRYDVHNWVTSWLSESLYVD